MEGSKGSADPKRPFNTARAIVMALAVAVVTAIGTGIGTGFLGLFDSDDPLISAAATEDFLECGTPVFLPAAAAQRQLRDGKAPGDWRTFAGANDGAVADRSVVEVAIQGEGTRVVTLTRLDVTVDRRARPEGAVFTNPCGDAIRGRSLTVDLDRDPPAVVRSVGDPEGVAAAVDAAGRSPFKPLRFPWTVSVSDPLVLRVIAFTERCYCTWRAAITWRSGDKSGRLAIDNGGSGYTVVGAERLRHYTNSGEGKQRWQAFEPS